MQQHPAAAPVADYSTAADSTDEVSVAGSFTGNTPAETECPPLKNSK